LWLFWEFVQSDILRIVYRDDRSDPNEIESIANLRSDIRQGELASAILSALSDICDISDGFTVEILQFHEVKKGTSPLEATDISYDIRESGIYIGLVEFSMEREYLDTSVGTGFFDFELSKHRRIIINYEL
jgi:hypothetical protein